MSAAAVFAFIVSKGIALIAAVGNVFICYVICRQKLRSTTFTLIFGQCMSDIFYVIFSAVGPYVVCRESVVFGWSSGRFLCSLRSVLAVSCYAISTLSMMAIAIERFVRFYFPTKEKLTFRQTVLIVMAIYFLGVALSFVGITGINEGVYGSTSNATKCLIVFEGIAQDPFFTSNAGFSIFIFGHQFIPMIVTTLIYVLIGRKLLKMKQIGVNNSRQKQLKLEKRMKTIKMLIIIMVTYYVLTCPIRIRATIGAYTNGFRNYCNRSNPFSAAYLTIAMAITSTAISPFILTYFNTTIKNEFRRIFLFRTKPDANENSRSWSTGANNSNSNNLTTTV